MMQTEQQIEQLGFEIYTAMKGEMPGIFNPDYWQGRLMEYVLKDPSFKVDMFRLVDVLPVLEKSDQVAEHVREYLIKEGRTLPTMMNMAIKAASSGLTAGIAASAIRKNVTEMAERFIVGKDAQESREPLLRLHKEGIAFTVDILGEATVCDEEADSYQKRYLNLIDGLAEEVKRWPEEKTIDFNHAGPIPRANVSIKVTAMDPMLKTEDPAGGVARLVKRLLPLFLRAKEKNVFLNLDLEQWAMHGLTYDLFEELVTHPELRNWPHMGVVVQAYLKSAHTDVARLLSIAKSRQTPLTVRLVKGAYWDYEVVNALQRGLDCPVLTDKAATDAQYEQLSDGLLTQIDHLWPAFGSHNLRSVASAMVAADSKKVPKNAFEIQMLYGMAEPERKVLRALGNRVRVYAPVGDLLPGMAYLVRRLLENTSNSGFLRLSHHGDVDVRSLMRKPQANGKSLAVENEGDFKNAPSMDFTDAAVRGRFQKAIEHVRASLPYRIPVVIGGVEQHTGLKGNHFCPSQKELTVAQISLASPERCTQAVEIAYQAYPKWRDTPLEVRAGLLDKLADRLQADQFELAALQTIEVGKPWAEADADVGEAVDFCRYYARQARAELSARTDGSVLGEHNVLTYEGRGPTSVIAPWNFPLAILCGMTTAALVSGNPVLMKPSEQSSAIAYALFKRLLECGFPSDVVQFVPGVGEKIGPILVEHPYIAQIAFTGSKEVGLHILKTAAAIKPGQPQLRRVVCEMGGKNAIIVDDDADLDEAVLAVMHSAFGFAGQKCSACSRVLVVGDLYNVFSHRLVEAAKSLTLGNATDPGCRLGPVIDESAQRRLLQEIETSKTDAKALYIGQHRSDGFFVPPAIFEVSSENHRLMQTELFGPVLAIMRVKNFEEALRIATSTEFALTGGVFSRNPSHLALAKKKFRVGNLYLNRGCTGAYVHRQPFGGFGMSGLGTKAGGPGYLLNFVDPRNVTENTMRRGFTPELDN